MSSGLPWAVTTGNILSTREYCSDTAARCSYSNYFRYFLTLLCLFYWSTQTYLWDHSEEPVESVRAENLQFLHRSPFHVLAYGCVGSSSCNIGLFYIGSTLILRAYHNMRTCWLTQVRVRQEAIYHWFVFHILNRNWKSITITRLFLLKFYSSLLSNDPIAGLCPRPFQFYPAILSTYLFLIFEL